MWNHGHLDDAIKGGIQGGERKNAIILPIWRTVPSVQLTFFMSTLADSRPTLKNKASRAKRL